MWSAEERTYLRNCLITTFTYDWCSAPTAHASATSRDYSQGNFHRCHSTTHGICVPSLEWRTNSKPTKTTRFILQETWDLPASTTDSIRLSGSAPQDEINLVLHRRTYAHFFPGELQQLRDIRSESQGKQFQQLGLDKKKHCKIAV